ncbi:hypothetical protein QTJ16_006619 [Diplocarpon rosae]|uniref:Fibroin-3 related protein n=1 Tax=Diplocarpon rosae TaxID=946125 RepID=A0AAD9WA96_9HELO|nr:hypothetical protein QTJ16_006619 [Diplocarpon rosae]
MPHITAAMHASVKRGLVEILADSVLGRRAITDEITNVADAFSSWDNCMNAKFCKWPVIALIIVGGLILLSIATCVGRVCCCGASCCCTCFSFLSCCDCCGGDSCAGKKDKPMKHLDSTSNVTPGAHHGYQAPAPMMGGALSASGLTAGAYRNVAPSRPEPPQYAQFEVGKNGLYVEPKPVALHEDALPPMPSWDAAAKKHVEDEKDAVELRNLESATGQNASLIAGAAATGTAAPPSPTIGPGQSPLGAQPGQGAEGKGYMGIAGDNYGQNQSAHNVNGRYGSPAPGQGGRQGAHGAYGAGAPLGYEGEPQRQYSNGQYSNIGRPPPNRPYTGDSSRTMAPGRQFTDRSYGSDNFQPNGPPRGPSRGPGPYGGFQNGPPRGPSRGPGPHDGYHNGPVPRGPSRGPGGPMRTASPFNNVSGFDSVGGVPHSRATPPPQQYQNRSPPSRQNYGRQTPQTIEQGYFDDVSTAAPAYSSRMSPPPAEPAYPGYKPYTPVNQPPTSPGVGQVRAPQSWDPVRSL